jgi:hypothetical protein
MYERVSGPANPDGKKTKTKMQSIETKYIGPSVVRGSRVKATCSGGMNITLEWDNRLSSDENHDAAAAALIKRLGWHKDSEPGATYGDWHSGATKGGGRVYVCTLSYSKLEVA